MKLDEKTGCLEITNNLTLYPEMTRDDLLKQSFDFEKWGASEENLLPNAYRLELKTTEFTSVQSLILIVNFKYDIINSWELIPRLLITGKNARRARVWFREETGIKLPISSNWGYIDAKQSYDIYYVESTTIIICNYKVTNKNL